MLLERLLEVTMPILILLRYGAYGLLACALAYGAGYWKGKLAELDRAQQAENVAVIVRYKTVDKIVVQYVKQIERVNVPGPVIVKRLDERLCNVSPDAGKRSPDAAKQADSPDARASYRAAFAEEIRNCVKNSDQLDSLIEAVKP